MLELTRWDEPDDTERHPEGKDCNRMRGHTNRAFACAILLRAGGDPETCDYLCGENDTLVQLLVSVVRLMDRELQRATAQRVAWRLGPDSTDRVDLELPAFFELALFLLSFFLEEPLFDDLILVRWADSLIDAENRVREKLGYHAPDVQADTQRWLLGLTHYDQKHDAWEALARRVQSDASRLSSDVARAKVVDISVRVLGQSSDNGDETACG